MFTNHEQNGRPKLVWYAELVHGSELCKPRFRYTEIVWNAEMPCKVLYLMFLLNDRFWGFGYFPKALWGYLGDYYKFLEYNKIHLHEVQLH